MYIYKKKKKTSQKRNKVKKSSDRQRNRRPLKQNALNSMSEEDVWSTVSSSPGWRPDVNSRH